MVVRVFGKSSGGSNEVFLMKIIIVVTVNLTIVSSKFALALSGYAVKLVALGPITYIPPHTYHTACQKKSKAQLRFAVAGKFAPLGLWL